MRAGSAIATAALAGTSLLAALLALELGVRVVESFDRNTIASLADYAPRDDGAELSMADFVRLTDDSLQVYELRPGTRGRFLGQELRINELGMRDRERSARKPDGVFRILALGDSHQFGWGVGQDESFARVLEALLEARAPGRFEVLNAGVPGYNTVMETRLFERRADELAPDLVVIHYVDNDMDLPNFLAEPPDPWSLRRSHLVDLVSHRLRILAGERVIPSGLFVAALDPETGRYQIPEEQIPEVYRPLQGWDRMVAAYRRLATLARERGIPIVLLVNWHDVRPLIADPSADVLPPRVRGLVELCEAEGYRVVEPQARMARVVAERGLDYRDLWITREDTHMSALFHRITAEELLARLDAAGLLPATRR